MGPYVFTGFVPLSVNPKHGTQGWKVNGNEVTFTNCDGKLNSYFAVLLNANKADYTLNNGWKNSLMYAWYELATPVSDLLPEAIFSPDYDIHHGGCGGYSIGKTETDVTGVTIGQRFSKCEYWYNVLKFNKCITVNITITSYQYGSTL
ncbi:hypothetical protein DPMN_152392 [Dreissena polymorpha]|uniref:Uncharacterized protein n=1 Tax=Dreissena polymorpha TaxID=45954 RepID=A0A9D4FGR8_DREPO|nr:hypothetical protein DPMN_152392 [Dreissena polymorpha]